jgi:hypothetical protein
MTPPFNYSIYGIIDRFYCKYQKINTQITEMFRQPACRQAGINPSYALKSFGGRGRIYKITTEILFGFNYYC